MWTTELTPDLLRLERCWADSIYVPVVGEDNTAEFAVYNLCVKLNAEQTVKIDRFLGPEIRLDAEIVP